MGPILRFRGLKEDYWFTSALVVIKGEATPPELQLVVEGKPLQYEDKATLLKTMGDCYVWRLEWSVLQTNEEQPIDYSISGRTFRYIVPERDNILRLSYASCFGFHSSKDAKKIKEKNAMWEVLWNMHQEKSFHLMLMGGDQVYADPMWDVVDPLKEWSGKPEKQRVKAPFTKRMQQLVEQFYFDLYCQRWSDPVPASVMGQIPAVMMWDDHDIFDGWGSYPPEQQQCEVFKGIYKVAREHFRIFQLQAKDDTDFGKSTLFGQTSYTHAYRIGNIAILTLDLRSERTQKTVMSPETWGQVYDWMNAEFVEKANTNSPAQSPCKHLLVMSSLPVVYFNLNMIEVAFRLLPGQQELEDDLKDQWLSQTHQGERLRLIHRLLKFSKESGCRVTILSGDVHIAALGYIQSQRDSAVFDEANVINQLISSAIVNIPPPSIILYMMEKILGDKIEEIDRDITARMLKFPGTAQRFIGARNWLALTLDEQDRLWAEWHVEGEEAPYTKVVHPVGALTS